MDQSSFREQIRAQCIVDPVTGCWTWDGRNKNTDGFPYVKLNDEQITVRQALMNPERTPNVAIYDQPECLPRCLNPDHLIRVKKGSGALLGPGGPRPGSYVVNERGCWLWKGYISHKNQPTAVVKGKNIVVRRFTYLAHGGDPTRMLEDHCSLGEINCVNPEHILLRNKGERRGNEVRKRQQQRREDALHADINRNRKVSTVKDDLQRMMTRSALDKLPDNLLPAWFSAVEYTAGHTNKQIGDAAGVTPQAINLRLLKLDKWLRGFHERLTE